MKLGVILPSFRDDPAMALSCAAYAAGRVDGVFAYDHLFPMGSPERPALAPFPLLAAVAAQHPELSVGPLVARVGLVPDDTLLGELRALAAVVGEGASLVAALGVGDTKGEPERVAYGLPAIPLEERLASLQVIADAIAAEGAEVWLGGAGPSVAKVATATGSAVNLWGVSPEQLAQRAAHSAVTWAGVSSWWNDWGVSMEQALDSLEQAGARWCVVGWPPSADDGAQRALLDAFAAWRSR